MIRSQEIKKRKQETNAPQHRYSTTLATLPVFLCQLVNNMLNGLVEKLQQMVNGKNSVENILQKRAIQILRAGQQRLPERIGGMSSEKQFYYAYMIHSLAKSLVGYQGSLEQLEAAAETHMLVSLLVGIAHGPEEGVYRVVIPAFSSMIHEGGVVLVQNSAVLEAFQEIDADFHLSAQLKHHTSVDSEVRDLVKGQTVLPAQSGLSLMSSVKEVCLTLKPKAINYVNKVLYGNKGGTIMLKHFNKLPRHGCGDAYKSVAHSEMPLAKDILVVSSDAGPKGVSCTGKTKTIIEDILFVVKDTADHSVQRKLSAYFTEIENKLVNKLGVIPPSRQHDPTPPPQPSPATSWCWCWKRRLESVTDPQQYICTASQEALEELDSECHETICHAIASVFGAHTAVTLIHLLHNNVSPTLLSAQDKHGNTPLHNAATAGDAVIARELVVVLPSAVCVRNHDCLTPLDIALDHRNDEMVESLLRECVHSAPHKSLVIQLLESRLVKSLKNGYTHFLQLVLQLRTEHGLAIDFECTDSSGHTAWHYLKQAAPAVRAVVVELLQGSHLQQPLLGRLLKSLSFDACPHSPLEISRDPAAIDHRDTTLPSTSDSEESDADSTASIPESSEEDQGNVDSTTAATPLLEKETPPNDGVDPPTEGAGDEEQSRASIATETDVGPAQVEREESIEHAPDSISNPEGAASALETPSELVDQKDVLTSTTSTTLGEQSYSEQTVSQPIEQASPPSDSVGGGVEPKQSLHTPLYSQEPQNDSSTGKGTSDKEETVLPDGDREEKVDELATDVNTAAETEGDKEREQFQVEPPLPAPKPLAVGEPSLELALAEIRRQLKEEQDRAVANLKEEYESFVAEKEKKLIAEVEKLKQAYSELVTEVEENRSNDDKHSQAISLSSTHSQPTSLSSNKSTHSLPTLLSNSESTHSNSESTTDSSVHLPSTDTAHTEAILVLSDYTSAEDHRPLRYSQPYTDSVTSSPNDSSSPQKPSVPKSRRKQRRTAEERVSLYRPSTTSGSDNRESSKGQSQRSRDSKKARVKRSSYSKCDTYSSKFSRYRPSTTSSLREPSMRRPHRSRDGVKARAKSGSFSEYEISPPLSNNEHSTADTAVSNSLPCESIVDERPTLLPAPSSPSHRLAQLKSRKQRSEKKSSQKTKLVTLSTFFRASGEFDKKVFKTWITRTVSRYSYKHIVHQQLFAVFGFSPLKVKLNAKERRMALAVLDFVKSTKHSIPQEVESNLKTMEKVVKSTRHVNETEYETKSGDGLAKKNEADTHEKQQHYTEESEVDKSTKPSPAEPQMCCIPQNSEKDDSTQLSPSQRQMDSTQTSADEVEPPLPVTKPLVVGEPSLELALEEIRRQLKEEQDSAVAKLREEYASLVAEREMKLIAEMEKLKEEQEYRETKLREELKEQLKGELREIMREEYENLATAEVVKLKEANPVLVAELQELKRHTGFEHSQLLTNSESATDISQSSDETTDTTSVEDQRTRRPQQYSHPCTGSITSSAPSDSSLPQKPPVSESRKRQRHKAEQRISLNRPSTPSSSDTRKHTKSEIVKKNKHSMSEVRKRQRHNTQERLSLYRPSTSSSSDTREPSKRRPPRSRPWESVKKKKQSSSESGKRQKQIFSLYRPSTSSGSDTTEHSKKRQCRHRDSSSDSVKTETYSECETTLFDNHSPESTVKDNSTHHLTSPLHILKSGAGRRRQTLRSKYKNRTKLVTLAKFFTATGRFNKEGFKTWLTAIVGRSSYNHLRTVVHHKLFAVFGFSSPKLRKLSRRERVIGRAVISLVSSKKFPVPPSVKDNLQSLKAVLDAQKKSSVSLPSKSEALEPLLHGPKIENDQEESSVDSDSSANDTLTDTQPWTRPTPEECVGASLLHFANTSYLIHCPVKVCHPPQNTCPPYDTFGGNYYTIADQHSDPASHFQTDHTEELSAARSREYGDSESHCVVPDITTPGEVEVETTPFEVEVGTTPFEVSSSDSSGPCTVRPQPDNSCCSPFLAGLPKPTAVPQDTPNCSTAIALVRLHYKYCTNEIQIFNPHMAANLGEVIEELTGLFEHKLCTGGFTKMVIITDTENYYTDLDNIIQTCLLKKYYLQLVPRHQLKFGDPEQPHRISLSECSGEHACVVGNPTLPLFVINGNRLRNLPGAAAEVAFLTHLFQCHPLTLKEASKEAVTNKLERARFAHLATHDYNKGLVLSDAVLTSSDIEQLLFERGPPVLVVLNCCGTADTVCERKGLESIALALLKVNVLAVVAVFGSVEDKLALRFAKLFYHYMIEVGLPATHALYNAQHEVYPPDFTHQYIYLGKDLKFIK